MISEKKFAGAYTSFWHSVTPLTDRYVRLQNTRFSRFAPPVPSLASTKLRGVTNELAFRIFCACHLDGLSASELDTARANTLLTETIDFITRFRDPSARDMDTPVKGVLQEARTVAQSLLYYYQNYHPGAPLTLRPQFPGIGILDACAGDVLAGSTLYEIKAAERSFRVVDVRQVLVYCALNYAAGMHTITRFTLLNPRMGTYFSQSVEQLATGVSGTTSAELFAEIIDFLSQRYESPGDEWPG